MAEIANKCVNDLHAIYKELALLRDIRSERANWLKRANDWINSNLVPAIDNRKCKCICATRHRKLKDYILLLLKRRKFSLEERKKYLEGLQNLNPPQQTELRLITRHIDSAEEYIKCIEPIEPPVCSDDEILEGAIYKITKTTRCNCFLGPAFEMLVRRGCCLT